MQGVMYDSAQSYYQLGLANQFGDATPTLHLFSSDDTPTPNVSPSSYQELSNDSYAPLPVPDGFWQFLTSPSPPHFGIIDAEWNLGPAGPFGDDTIFGWWLDGFSPRLGQTVGFFGGRFESPVTIPPAGLVLTLSEIDLYLHDCGTVPPPPVAYLLRADFAAVNGTPLNTYVPEVGPVGTTFTDTGSGIFSVEARTAQITSVSHSADGVLWDVGQRDYEASAYLTVIPATEDAGLVVRAIDALNHYLVEIDATLRLVEVWSRVAGAYTLRASTSLTRGGEGLHYLHVRCDHDTISVVADGADSITYTAGTLFPSATQVGIFSGGEAVSSTVQFGGLAVVPL